MNKFTAVLLLVLTCCLNSIAQSGKIRPREAAAPTATPPPIAQPTNNQSGAETVADDDVIKVDSTLITIPVSVLDRQGHFLIDLQQPDFEIFENGKQQQIAYFAATEQPITVALLLDVSPSADNNIKQIRSAAQSFVRQLKPADRVMVISFSDDVKLLSEATSDRTALFKAIEKAKIKDGTALYDAVDFAINRQLQKITGRKAIVLLTDGVNTSSQLGTFENTVAAAQNSEAVVYPIKYNTYSAERDEGENIGVGTSREEYEIGAEYLEDLADKTGGKIYNADSLTNLDGVFSTVAQELRYQYSIGYYPTEVGKPGERKSLKVRVKRENVNVRARDNYIVGGNR